MEANDFARVKEYINKNPKAQTLVTEATRLLDYAEEDEFLNDFLGCILPRITGRTLLPRVDYIKKWIDPFLESHMHNDQTNIACMEQPVGIFWLILLPLLILLSPILIPAGLMYLFGMPRLRCIVENFL